MLTLGLMTLFTLVNLLSVRSWGEAEYWFASIKVAAIALFLVAGAVVIAGLWPAHPAGSPISPPTAGSCRTAWCRS